MKIKSILNCWCILGLLVGLVVTPWASQAAPASGSISGTITYDGSYDADHEVLVSAHLSLNGSPVASVHIDGPGVYSLAEISDGSYYISAFLDIHDRGGGPPDAGEPVGWYDADGDGNPDQVIINGSNMSGIDITMEDITDEYIQGTACYFGGAQGSGQIEIGLHTVVGQEPVTYQYLSSRPCADYIFSGGPSGTYYVSLFYDLDGSSGPPDDGEPIAWYDEDGDGNPDPIIYTGDVITDINVTLGKTRHYVDFRADGKNDGSSWEDAYHDLMDAIAAAQSGQEIWVAAGVYTPGTTRAASFVLQHGVAVYGGFKGTEDYRQQRNPRANVTVLSGEIGDPSIKTDNVYHVITTASTFADPLDETAVIDGFTITGGYANGEGQDDKGGGFRNDYGTPSLVNLNFVDNYAVNHGGALVTQYNSNPLTVVNSTFSGNHSTNNAGGIANIANIKVVNSSFVGNTGNNGGGIVSLTGTQTEVYNSILWDNQGNDISLQGTATATVTYSIVDGGFAGGSHILTSDPQFLDADGPDDIYGTFDDDLHVQATSPAIDAGDIAELLVDIADSNGNDDTSETTPMDFDGENRLRDDQTTPNTGNGSPPVDIGADEYDRPVTISGLSASISAPTFLSEAITFSARVISGTQITYSWDFGDGRNDHGGAVSHAYTEPGVYTVILTAANSLGSQQISTSVTIGEEIALNPGHTHTTADGILTFEIPASMTDTLMITYTPQVSLTQDIGEFRFGGLVFNLEAVDDDGVPIVEPGAPITLTVHYDENALPLGMDESLLELRRYDETNREWVALSIVSRDLVADSISVYIDHFSAFALLWVEPTVVEQMIYLPIVLP
jgi:hypothetical protein